MNTILLPTDFSENAFNAIRYAVAFYKGETCRFILFHAYEEPRGSAGMLISIRDMIKKNAFEDMKVLLKRVAALKPEKQHAFETQAVYGHMTSTVLRVAKQENADLIIMGTQGASGFKEKLWGSNAANIVRKAPIPVLAVPHNAHYARPERIALATDFEPVSDNAIFKPLIETTLHFEAQLMVLHISQNEESKKDRQLIEQNIELKKNFRFINDTYHFVKNDDLQEGIVAFIEEKDVQLLAMVTRDHGLFDRIFHHSSVEKLAFHSQIPLLAIHN